jgi:hypothetical protein
VVTEVISNRSADAFDNPEKTMTREKNLAAIRESAEELWADDNRSKLRCFWAELMGDTGHLTLDLLEKTGALASGGFVGIDLDGKRIDVYRERYPGYGWVAGDLFDCLSTGALAGVGVLNYDSYDAIGNAAALHVARHIRALARRAIDSFGAFGLMWNGDLDSVRRLGERPSIALRRHAVRLARAFVDAGDVRRSLDADAMLPPGAEHVLDRGFTGQLGAFSIYRGRPGGHRMANLRMVLR